MTKNEGIPSIPHKFGGVLYGSTIHFKENTIYCAVTSGNTSLGSEIHYDEILSVQVKSAKRILGFSIGCTTLRLSKSLKSYNSASEDPVVAYLSCFNKKEWPVILNLLRHCAPNAKFCDLAMSIISGSSMDNNE